MSGTNLDCEQFGEELEIKYDSEPTPLHISRISLEIVMAFN